MSSMLASPAVLADRLERFQLSGCAVEDLVREAVDYSRAAADDKSIRFAVDVPASLHISVQRDLFLWALCRLVGHAVDSSPNRGEVVITAVDTGQGVDVEVADSGPGMIHGPQASLAGVTAIDENGSPVSLAWIDHVARRHGGRSFVMNCPEGGAAYTLRISKLIDSGGRAKAA